MICLFIPFGGLLLQKKKPEEPDPMEQQTAAKPNVMIRVATFIVDKRSLIFLLVGIAIVFSAFSRNWVSVENDLTAYLPAGSSTREGLELMDDQFITYGSAKIMVANVSYEEAEALFDAVKAVEGVQNVDFDRTTEHYSKASALFSITFDYEETDEECLDALASVRALLAHVLSLDEDTRRAALRQACALAGEEGLPLTHVPPAGAVKPGRRRSTPPRRPRPSSPGTRPGS